MIDSSDLTIALGAVLLIALSYYIIVFRSSGSETIVNEILEKSSLIESNKEEKKSVKDLKKEARKKEKEAQKAVSSLGSERGRQCPSPTGARETVETGGAGET